MALSSSTVYEVQTGGNDTNGGGFVTGASGTDFSLVTGKRTGADVTDISTTDAVGNGTTTLTSATANFTTAIIGNIIYLQGGTGALAATRRQVTARASATSITVDASVATGTGITMNIGGCLATPGEAGRASASGQTVWIKSGTYTQTTTSSNVSGGGYSISSRIFGYQTTRGDFTSTRPLLQANGVITGFNMISSSALIMRGVNLDCNNRTSSRGAIITSTGSLVMDCNFANATNGALVLASGVIAINCKATGCSSAAAIQIGAGIAFNCVAHDNTNIGFSFGTGGGAHHCIADTNTGASSDGFSVFSADAMFNCVAYANGRDGFRIAANTTLVNCIAESNTGNGFGVSGGNPVDMVLRKCAAYGNGTDFNIGTGAGTINIDSITGASSFFTNPASQDFSLNNTASAGASCRAAGIPGVTPDGNSTGYLDVGAIQHQDPASSGGAHSAVF